MIVTLTPNPSIDRTITLSEPLERGAVLRSAETHDEAGGKGVNVAQAVRNAGRPAVAVLPGDHDDPLLQRLRSDGLTHRAVATGLPSRVNLTFAEPDGTTTKVNAPGPTLSPAALDQLVDEVAREAVGARWAALCGSLPPGAGADWYARVAVRLAEVGVAVAVDTSGRALREVVAAVPSSIALLKPNDEELADLVGVPAESLTDAEALHRAARPLVDAGVGGILLTLGARGALLVTAEGTWECPAPSVQARSTVGAGDSALAGYLLAALDNRPPADRLAHAVAYGAAAASLPGSRMPTPDDLPTLTEAALFTGG